MKIKRERCLEPFEVWLKKIHWLFLKKSSLPLTPDSDHRSFAVVKVFNYLKNFFLDPNISDRFTEIISPENLKKKISENLFRWGACRKKGGLAFAPKKVKFNTGNNIFSFFFPSSISFKKNNRGYILTFF